jgi:hypothetical protein
MSVERRKGMPGRSPRSRWASIQRARCSSLRTMDSETEAELLRLHVRVLFDIDANERLLAINEEASFSLANAR